MEGTGPKTRKNTLKKFSKNCQSSRLSMVILHRPNRQRTRHAMASHRIASVQKHLRALSATTQDIWHGIRHRIALRQFGAEKAKRCRPHLCQAWPDLSQTSLITVFRETKFHFAKIVNQIITKTKTATPPLSRHETKQTALETLRDETKQRFRENFTKNVYESDPWGPGGYQMLNHETAHGFTDATA